MKYSINAYGQLERTEHTISRTFVDEWGRIQQSNMTVNNDELGYTIRDEIQTLDHREPDYWQAHSIDLKKISLWREKDLWYAVATVAVLWFITQFLIH